MTAQIRSGGTSDTVRGLVRTVVQIAVSAVLALGPVQAILDAAGMDVDGEAVVGVIVVIVMGAYWWLLTLAQRTAFVQSQPVLRWVIGVLMGGFDAPAYGDPSAKYTVVNPDGTETPLLDYIDGKFGA